MHGVHALSYTPWVRRIFIVPLILRAFASSASSREASATTCSLPLTASALLCLSLFLLCLSPKAAFCQAQEQLQHPSQGSSSSSGGGQDTPIRVTQPEATGSGVTLETSEPLFDLAVALNTCGYDTDLAASDPVRASVRQQVAASAAASPEAGKTRDALCTYIREHTLADSGLNIAQYVSLALYTSPNLIPTADETELPPDSTQVLNILPLLHNFADAIHLHAIWVESRPAYNAIVERLHDPLTKMILNTNIYLRSPVSSYDGRRFLVLLEPMLAPTVVNARVYGSNYIITISPSAAGSFHMEQIRHTYLHYEVEPMIYARASAMDRLQPILKSVQDAPIDFAHKSDIVSLITECLIKAIEARTMDTGLAPPAKPSGMRERVDFEKYDAAKNLFERQTEAARRNTADLATRHGWVLTNYFYQQLVLEEHNNVSLKDNIGQMVYGMDVDRQAREARQVAFIPEASHDVVRRVATPPTGLRLAEMKLMQGDAPAAEILANKALSDPAGDHAEANYLLARIALLQRQPEEALTHFQATLASARNPHTVAWSHIYLGRLYDVQPDRKKAMQEYQAALSVPGAQADTRVAASTGLKTPFALPKQAREDDDKTLDPSGKAEKDAYSPNGRL